MKLKSFFKTLGLPILLVLTLGLAPYTPEPHLFGKVRWIAGGAEGMEPKDWFDLFFHGFPFVLILYKIIEFIRPRTK